MIKKKKQRPKKKKMEMGNVIKNQKQTNSPYK